MKKMLFAIGLIAATLLAYAQQDQATVIFVRPANIQASSVSFKFYINDSSFFKLFDGTYYSMNLNPGKYTITTRHPYSSIELNVEAGRSYYYRPFLMAGFFSSSFEVLLIDSAQGASFVAKGKLHNMRTPLPVPRIRFNAGLMGGFGFHERDILKTAENEDVSFGFGGGGGVYAEVAYAFTKRLDIELAYAYISQGLNPPIKNGSLSFYRHVISLSPHLIIPIDGGSRQRIRLGAGVDFSVNNRFEIRLEQIQGGIKDNQLYNNAVGFNGSFIYESHLSKAVSVHVGLRYSNIRYSFKSGDNYYPLEDFFAKPNGEALEVRFGLGFHLF